MILRTASYDAHSAVLGFFSVFIAFLLAPGTRKMGITRSRLHKRRPTGGKMNVHRKKRKYEMGRPSSMTKLRPDGERRVHTVRVRGGATKFRALRLSDGVFSWGSEVGPSFSAVLWSLWGFCHFQT